MTMSTTSPEPSEPRSLIRYGLIAFAITIVVLWALYQVRSTLLLIYVCVLFATGLSPLVRMIERRWPVGRRRLPRPAAILVIYGTVLGVIAAIGFAVVPPMVRQSQQFWKELPDRVDQFQRRLVSWGLISPDTSYKDLLQQTPGGGDAVGMVLSTVWGFVGGLFGLVTILLLTFYLLVESQSIFSFFVRLFPRQRRGKVSEVSALVTDKVSAWLGGQLVLGFIIGVTTAIGLALGVAVFFLVQQQLENAVLVPKLMGQTVGLSAVTVILSLLIGGELLGFVGALLAVPTAAIVQVLFEELYLAEKNPVEQA